MAMGTFRALRAQGVAAWHDQHGRPVDGPISTCWQHLVGAHRTALLGFAPCSGSARLCSNIAHALPREGALLVSGPFAPALHFAPRRGTRAPPRGNRRSSRATLPAWICAFPPHGMCALRCASNRFAFAAICKRRRRRGPFTAIGGAAAAAATAQGRFLDGRPLSHPSLVASSDLAAQILPRALGAPAR